MGTLEKLEELLNGRLSKNQTKLFEEDLDDVAEKYIERNNLCSKCMCELEEKPRYEYRGECWGEVVYEPVYELCCPRCEGE